MLLLRLPQNCCCCPASIVAPQVTAQSLDDAANATDPNPLDVPATLLLSGRYAASALLAELAAAEAPADPNPGSLDDYLFGAGVPAAPEDSGELGICCPLLQAVLLTTFCMEWPCTQRRCALVRSCTCTCTLALQPQQQCSERASLPACWSLCCRGRGA